jgi:hypothetical protein
MKVKLETIANLTIVITGVAMTALLVSRFVAERQQPPPPISRQYQVGEKMAAGFPVDFSSSAQTLLLVLSSRCHYCSESVPFYRDVLDAHRADARFTRLVAIGLEDKTTLQEYLTQQGLAFDDVVTVTQDNFKVVGTPTLLLVDRLGTVKGVWPGLLNDDRRKQQVLKSLVAPGPV